jgi:hypothetical protein
MGVAELCGFMNPHPVLIDVRGMVDRVAAEGMGIYYRKL